MSKRECERINMGDVGQRQREIESAVNYEWKQRMFSRFKIARATVHKKKHDFERGRKRNERQQTR